MKKKLFFVLVAAMASVMSLNAQSVDSKVVDEKVESILKTLTLREKIAQIIVVAMNSQNSPERKFTQDSLVAYEQVYCQGE